MRTLSVYHFNFRRLYTSRHVTGFAGVAQAIAAPHTCTEQPPAVTEPTE